MYVDIALIEWPGSHAQGGPRLLGRLSDPDLVQAVRERLAAQRRRELDELAMAHRVGLRLVESHDETPEPREDGG